MRYREVLADTIIRMIKEGKVTFVDCMNCIDQYMFKGKCVDNLYVTRIEVIFDLVDLLERMKPGRILLSSYKHLLEDLREDEADEMIRRIDAQLMRLGKSHDVEVMEWDIRYRRRGR